MRVAIIGGGASGLITAYLLRQQHATVVFEQAPVLGGHIRTINGNVRGHNIDDHVVVENGVVGFDLTTYPTFRKLAAELELELTSYAIHLGLFYPNGHYLLMPSDYQRSFDSPWERLRNFGRLLRAYPSTRSLLREINALTKSDLEHRATSDFIPDSDDPGHKIMLACFMLAFSVPYSRVGDIPAEISVAYMQGEYPANWYFLKSGAYSYIEKMIGLMPEGHVRRCSAGVESVTRSDRGVFVKAQGSDAEHFDAVVFATTPGRVLTILADPTDTERRRFGAWSCNEFKTVAHKDPGLYQSYRTATRSPCDYFMLRDERRFGYNTYINHGYGYDREVPYSFAYNLEHEIAADKIIHTAHHTTPDYTVEAFRYRKEIIATNGENDTFYVGAWMGNALHEGAAQSANDVSALLGGHVL